MNFDFTKARNMSIGTNVKEATDKLKALVAKGHAVLVEDLHEVVRLLEGKPEEKTEDETEDETDEEGKPTGKKTRKAYAGVKRDSEIR